MNVARANPRLFGNGTPSSGAAPTTVVQSRPGQPVPPRGDAPQRARELPGVRLLADDLPPGECGCEISGPRSRREWASPGAAPHEHEHGGITRRRRVDLAT